MLTLYDNELLYNIIFTCQSTPLQYKQAECLFLSQSYNDQMFIHNSYINT